MNYFGSRLQAQLRYDAEQSTAFFPSDVWVNLNGIGHLVIDIFLVISMYLLPLNTVTFSF